jgi:hypothetical protein
LPKITLMIAALARSPRALLSARRLPSVAAMSAARAFSSLPPLLSTEQVQSLVDARDRRVRFLDASWYLDKSRDGRKEFEAERLPGAQFFDIEQIADKTSTLPHMLPTGRCNERGPGDLLRAAADRLRLPQPRRSSTP